MKTVTKWLVPGGDGTPLLTMPNVVKPLHSLNPRSIMGATEWKKTREACYAEHDDVCEVCGQKLCGSHKSDLPLHNCHEAYELDFVGCVSTFRRLICICPRCHNFIHSGRAITCYRNHTPLWSKDVMLDLARHGFELVHNWNKLHPDAEPLRVWRTFVDWLSEPSLHDELSEMIEKYDIHFYTAENADGENGTWSKWKLIYDGTEYYSPYEDMAAWAVEMAKRNNENPENNNLFSGGEFEELRKNIGKR